MLHEVYEVHDIMCDCPKCGKHALARRGEGHYHCIWCGFQRNISDGEHSYTMSPLGGLALAAMAIVVLASLAKADIPAQPTGQPSQGITIVEP
jgi:transposase-like protein